MLAYRDLTDRIIGLAIEVHCTIGPGLRESVSAACLCDEPAQAGIPFRRQVGVPVTCKGRPRPGPCPRASAPTSSVADAVLAEVRAVAALLPAHDAQVLTCLRMRHIRIGLRMNVHAPRRRTACGVSSSDSFTHLRGAP